MAWIEAHQSLQRHPKLLHLSRLVKTRRLTLVGHLLCLWWWALDYAQDGYVGKFDVETIAEAAEWTKEPGSFVDALRTARWLDADGKLHNWERYVGRLLDQRETSTKQRGGRARASTAERDTSGRFVAGPAVVDQQSPADQLTVPDRTVPTRPYLTEPDPTNHNSKAADAGAGAEANGKAPTDHERYLLGYLEERNDVWSLLGVAGLVKLNGEFGSDLVGDVLAEAKMRFVEQGFSPDDPFPWLRETCRARQAERYGAPTGAEGGAA